MDKQQKIAQLIEHLLNRDEQVRISARDELAAFGRDAIDPILEASGEANVLGLAHECVKALILIGEPAVEPLIAALENEYLHDEIVGALGAIGDIRAIQPLIDKVLTNSESDTYGYWAFKKLGEPALQALLVTLNDTEHYNGYARDMVAQALSEFKEDPRIVEPLLLALQDESPEARRGAVFTLGQTKDGRAFDHLLTALRDSDERVRKSAAQALAYIGDVRAVEVLIDVLKDEIPEVRGGAAWSLYKLGDRRAFESLLMGLNDSNNDVRRWCAAGVMDMGGPVHFEILMSMLDDSEWKVRLNGVVGLGKIGDPRSVESLMPILSGSLYGLRGPTAKALGKIGDPRAVEGLIAALNDRSSEVGRAAAEALRQIGTIESLIAVEEWEKRQVEPIKK